MNTHGAPHGGMNMNNQHMGNIPGGPRGIGPSTAPPHRFTPMPFASASKHHYRTDLFLTALALLTY